MTPQELKNSILQLAIQGKLVEQRPEEGTGEELYRQIQSEKQKLIREGKIKKEKPLPDIAEDEVPFDIPESWKWVRLGASFFVEMGQSPDGNSISIQSQGIEFHQGKVYFGKKELLTSPQNTTAPTKYADKNSVLLCVRAPVGKVNITRRKICIGRGLCAISSLCKISAEFIYFWLASMESAFLKKATGTTFVAITGEIVKSQPFPLPPLAEQKRIVAKIEELLPLIDRYEKAWSRLEEFNRRFPADMQKSLLQMAIQGKLVEQRPEEGTGEELYRQIQAEKQRLIKEGKIKKEKPLPDIAEDEVPFEIPESWKWCFVGELFSHNTGKAMNASAKKVDKSGSIRKFITTSNLYWNAFDFSTIKQMFFSDDELERCTIKKGDLLMNEGGAYFGRTAIWNYDYEICFQNHVHRLRPYSDIELMYFYHVFFFYRNMNMMRAKGTAMPGLSSVTLHNMMIPLPPLAEQKRIVAKLEELLPLCERLK